MLFLFSLSSALPYIFESGLLSEPGEHYSPFCLDWLARKTLGWFLLPPPHSAGVTGHRAQGTGRRVIHGSLHGCWGPEPHRPSCLHTESTPSLRLPGTALLYLMTTSVSPLSAPKQGRVHVLFDYCKLGLHDISKARHEAQETCPTLLRALQLCDLQGQGFRKERER